MIALLAYYAEPMPIPPQVVGLVLIAMSVLMFVRTFVQAYRASRRTR